MSRFKKNLKKYFRVNIWYILLLCSICWLDDVYDIALSLSLVVVFVFRCCFLKTKLNLHYKLGLLFLNIFIFFAFFSSLYFFFLAKENNYLVENTTKTATTKKFEIEKNKKKIKNELKIHKKKQLRNI